MLHKFVLMWFGVYLFEFGVTICGIMESKMVVCLVKVSNTELNAKVKYWTKSNHKHLIWRHS